jgi:hypothetical protein
MYLDGDLPEEAIQQEMRLAVSAAAVLCTLRCAVLCCAPESSRRCGWQHMSPPLLRMLCSPLQCSTKHCSVARSTAAVCEVLHTLALSTTPPVPPGPGSLPPWSCLPSGPGLPSEPPRPLPPFLPACLQGKAAEEAIAATSALFTEVQRVVDSKQLKPMIRTQYQRTAFQIPFDPTVRIRWAWHLGCAWAAVGSANPAHPAGCLAGAAPTCHSRTALVQHLTCTAACTAPCVLPTCTAAWTPTCA